MDPSARVVYAIGHLVLQFPKRHLTELGDLRKPEAKAEVQRLSITNPELTTYGWEAKPALELPGCGRTCRARS
jgi:hypothetical protein